MQKTYWGFAIGFSLLVLASTAQAEGWDNFWRDYHRNKVWPQPFAQIDRQNTLMPFAVMQNNGWQRENLMGAHHFSADNTELSEVGKAKAQWILTQAPHHRRTMFVEYAGDAQQTGARVRALQKHSTHYLPPGTLADVRPSHMVTEGWPAGMVDQTNMQFQEMRPAPVLPAATSSTSAQ